ncbi:MAG: cation:proton antiporter [Rubrobacter sp.]
MTFFEPYTVMLSVLGLALLGTALLPRFLENRPVSLPMLLLGFGVLAFSLPLGLPKIDPLAQNTLTTRLAELGVIIALMGAGLKIDRPPGWKAWRTVWLLLGITMPLTIFATALLGWWAMGLPVAAALLLGATAAPTDPVLASEIQVGSPGEGYEEGTKDEDAPTGNEEEEVRFALTSEAGLNDGLGFPFTYAAILVAASGPALSGWFVEWALIYVLYKVAVGVVLGLIFGRVLAKTVLSIPSETELARAITGISAVAAILIVYGLTEALYGYGFIAVFVAACAGRNYERNHEYHGSLHVFTEQSELLITAGIVVALGGAIAGGILAALTWPAALVGLALIFVIRPIAGLVALSRCGKRMPLRERYAIGFFGIRGVGSIYYLAYAFGEANFPEQELLWATVAFIVLVSIIVHGISGVPAMNYLDRKKAKEAA